MKLYFYFPKVEHYRENNFSTQKITGFECVEAEAKETSKCYCAIPGHDFPNGYGKRISKNDVGSASDGFRVCLERDDEAVRASLVKWYQTRLDRAESDVRLYNAAIAAIKAQTF